MQEKIAAKRKEGIVGDDEFIREMINEQDISKEEENLNDGFVPVEHGLDLDTLPDKVVEKLSKQVPPLLPAKSE